MNGAWRRGLFLTISCFLLDALAIAVMGRHLLFPTFANYCGLLWFNPSWFLRILAGFTCAIVAQIYGYWSFQEAFFLIATAISAFVLKQVLQESLVTAGAFVMVFLLLQAWFLGLKLEWSVLAVGINILVTYGILKVSEYTVDGQSRGKPQGFFP